MPDRKDGPLKEPIEWPNSFSTREELDSMLEEGLASGVSPLSGEEVIERAIRRVKEERGIRD